MSFSILFTVGHKASPSVFNSGSPVLLQLFKFPVKMHLDHTIDPLLSKFFFSCLGKFYQRHWPLALCGWQNLALVEKYLGTPALTCLWSFQPRSGKAKHLLQSVFFFRRILLTLDFANLWFGTVLNVMWLFHLHSKENSAISLMA